MQLKRVFDWKIVIFAPFISFTASFNSYDSEVVAFDAGPPPRDWKKNASPPSSQAWFYLGKFRGMDTSFTLKVPSTGCFMMFRYVKICRPRCARV